VSKENVKAADCLISEVVAEDSDKSLLRLMVLGKLGVGPEGGEIYRTRKERQNGQKKGGKMSKREERKIWRQVKEG
jgi:hypothetical protein